MKNRQNSSSYHEAKFQNFHLLSKYSSKQSIFAEIQEQFWHLRINIEHRRFKQISNADFMLQYFHNKNLGWIVNTFQVMTYYSHNYFRLFQLENINYQNSRVKSTLIVWQVQGCQIWFVHIYSIFFGKWIIVAICILDASIVIYRLSMNSEMVYWFSTFFQNDAINMQTRNLWWLTKKNLIPYGILMKNSLITIFLHCQKYTTYMKGKDGIRDLEKIKKYFGFVTRNFIFMLYHSNQNNLHFFFTFFQVKMVLYIESIQRITEKLWQVYCKQFW